MFVWMFLKSYYELAKSNSSTETYFYDIGYQCKCASTLFDLYKKINNITSNEAHKLFNELCEFDPQNNHMALADAKVQGKFFIKLNKLISTQH